MRPSLLKDLVYLAPKKVLQDNLEFEMKEINFLEGVKKCFNLPKNSIWNLEKKI
jgi:hypothetical protein